MSINDTDEIEVSVDITLEDTYESLKDLKNERAREIQNLITTIRNNEVRTLGPNVTPEEIRHKRLRYVESMQKLVAQEQPKDLPIPNTDDFYSDALKTLEEEVHTMIELNKITEEEITEIEKDIAYMENKKTTFAEMKEAYILAADNETSTNYEDEIEIAKQLFRGAKQDLVNVVDTLFPNNAGFQNLLTDLTKNHSLGGDDVYVDVEPRTVDFVHFLEEADIIQFHPGDKTKVKMRDL